MSELNVDFSISEKLEINISHTLLNAKIQLLVPFFWEELQRMFLTKWREIFMIVWVSLKTFTAIQDSFQVEEPLRWKSQQESMKKEANTQELNNFPSKLVILSLILVGYAL